MDHESPELIEQQMQDTRASLTDKVSELENRVVSSFESATSAVQDTVASVKSAMQDTVTTVKEGIHDSVHSVTESVQETLDVRKHVRANPWAFVGGAVAAGVVTGLIVFPSRRQAASHRIAELSSSGGPMRGSYQAPPPPVAHVAPAAPAEPRRPGVFDELLGMVGKELRQLGEMAVASAAASLKQQVNEGIPQLIQNAVSKVGEAVTPERDPWQRNGARQAPQTQI